MATFRSMTANRQPLQDFDREVSRAYSSESLDAKSRLFDTTLPLHLFEWSQGSQDGLEISDIKSVSELEAREPATVRVIFAPRDVPVPETVGGLLRLFDKFGIPSAFVAESMQNISQSFAAQKDIDGTTYVWFHFLCKTVSVSEGRIVHQQAVAKDKDEADQLRTRAQKLSQADFNWLKPGFVLKVRKQQSSSIPLSRTRTSSSDATMAAASSEPKVELFCFGAPATLGGRFRKLRDIAICDDLMHDPYVLLEIVLEEMYKVLDQTGWAISRIFGDIETQTLDMATTPGKAHELPRDHFTGLHNLAKHTTYLRENCDSALATLQGLRHHHAAVTGKHPEPAQEFTRQALEYRKTLFESTQRRLASLDKRMANIIQLSFHLVTQGDSRIMQSENQSMKTIAVMTMIFMPLSTIAGIFGTQFMRLDENAPFRMHVSQDFWLLWIIAAPLTVTVILIWRVWYYDARGRLIDELPPRGKGERGWLGWKTMVSRPRKHDVMHTDHEKAHVHNAAATVLST
ncbi:uncharacterized protein EKO05_0008697 [Ascochyta rabiei]|uniref:Metal ion transmembrane transporter n=1 Tax=Didymella rabiei TaxID=5454 RepID=A0A163FYH5_DIDRA|nr:uncharacterized protein EKO05_0008697 [Ascochyta rabiei]KZM24597.1 metal ion transmembrane transporter [Ascochyta rabiei]UPX18395.1 hypothetical protein EKO05_0008697 [Ascochyta rabiei]